MSSIRNIFIVSTLAAVHVLALVALTRATGFAPTSDTHAPFITVNIVPKIRDDIQLPAPALADLSFKVTIDSMYLPLGLPAREVFVTPNVGATVTAPIFEDDRHVDLRPFLAQASLLKGDGATVVLKVEVLESGDPGQIQVDVSSGSRQVDAAAVAYARTQRWRAGHLNGEPHSMWIRWSVRLQA